MFGVNLSVTHWRAIDVMNARGGVVWTADAAKCPPIAGRSGIVNVNELLCSLANNLHQPCRRSMVVSGLSCKERRGGY
jgi:hypothetical protein